MTPFDLTGRRVWVAGHRGMVGSAVVRRLAREPVEVLTAARSELDLTCQAEVEAWMTAQRPDVVVLAAARVGGIAANNERPAEFLYENLAIQTNVLHAAANVGVAKLLFLGSSCVYPKHAPQPIAEDALLTGPLEPTNQWYAIAKIAGLMLVDALRIQHGHDFISAMPTNVYGPGDNYDPSSSHVVAALIRRAHEAKVADTPELVVWGTGTPLREFIHSDDLADALVHMLVNYSAPGHLNVGSGAEMSIAALAAAVCAAVGYTGRIVFDPAKPDGTPRKLLDAHRLAALGWRPRLAFADGLADAYRAFLADQDR